MTPRAEITRIAAAAVVLALVAGHAEAQQEPQPGNPGPLPGPIVGGHDVQPHTGAVARDRTDPEADELLRQANDAGPVVPPHDLYGNPLGVDTQNIKTDPGRRSSATPAPTAQPATRTPQQ